MAKSRNRWLFKLALIPLLALAAYLWATQHRTEHFLTVENQAGQPIAVLRVTIAGQSKVLKDMAQGAKVTTPLAVRGDETFAVDGQLADGTLVKGHGKLPERAAFTILPGGQLNVVQAKES
jgi:hypothetical protein